MDPNKFWDPKRLRNVEIQDFQANCNQHVLILLTGHNMIQLALYRMYILYTYYIYTMLLAILVYTYARLGDWALRGAACKLCFEYKIILGPLSPRILPSCHWPLQYLHVKVAFHSWKWIQRPSFTHLHTKSPNLLRDMQWARHSWQQKRCQTPNWTSARRIVLSQNQRIGMLTRSILSQGSNAVGLQEFQTKQLIENFTRFPTALQIKINVHPPTNPDGQCDRSADA